MSSLIQRNFSSGEISPNLYSRVDTIKYSAGLRTMKNCLTMRMGGATNRAGSKFISEVKDSTKQVRLIDFVFNTLQTYVLEFGNLYIRFIKNDELIVEAPKTITGVTQAAQGVVTSASHGFSDGDQIQIIAVSGMLELNGRTFIVSDSAANTFKLKYLDGTYVNTTSFTAYISGGDAARIYTITTPYLEADLAELKYVQSADVMTITHHDYPPAELSRTSDTSWSINAISFAATIQPPTNVTNNGPGAGSAALWVVTSIASESFEESEPSTTTTSNTAPTSGAPINVAWTLNSSAVEYNVYKSINGIYGFIGVAGSNTFTDTGIVPDTSTTPPAARNPFGAATRTSITGITQASPAVVSSTAHGLSVGDVVFINSVAGMTQVNNKYFYVRTVPGANSFSLNSFTKSPIDSTGYTAYGGGGFCAKANDHLPATCTYFQQRLGFANTLTESEKIWLSQTGLFHNFNISTPIQDDDAVSFQLVGRQVNGVHHILDLGKFASFTQVGEWIMEGDQSGVILPGQINPKQRSYNGSSSTIAPVIVDSTALYVQARGSAVRDFNFDYQIDGYRGDEISLFSEHLLEGRDLLDVAYQKSPHSNVWFVRDDGVLLGLTYVPSQNILGWHRHEFENGLVENVCSIPYGSEDALYLTVNRTIDGREVRYIEKLNSRLFDDVVDAVFVDSSYSFDGRDLYAPGAYTLTLSGGTNWDYTETLTLTTSPTVFYLDDNDPTGFHLVASDGTEIRLEVVSRTNGTTATVRAHRTLPAEFRNVAITDFTPAKSIVTGLWHLEGEDVSILADGFVLSNPNNSSYSTITVTDGTIELDRSYAVIHIGLPTTADLETLNIDAPQSQTVSDKKMTVNRVSLHVKDSRGVWVGSEPPPDEASNFLGGLTEIKLRNSEAMDDPVALKTEVVDVIIQPQWNSHGRIFIRQTDPLPLTITAIVPDGIYPFKNVGT